eukprot:GHVU01022328.1.p1 GENE.GHVU01022328.1~~GHVU01022328.1.p1  ORF type:complete len:101 (+),score=13.39 GHVU01022328.1:40-303(+)
MGAAVIYNDAEIRGNERQLRSHTTEPWRLTAGEGKAARYDSRVHTSIYESHKEHTYTTHRAADVVALQAIRGKVELRRRRKYRKAQV